jgi:hypothetical protein
MAAPGLLQLLLDLFLGTPPDAILEGQQLVVERFLVHRIGLLDPGARDLKQ